MTKKTNDISTITLEMRNLGEKGPEACNMHIAGEVSVLNSLIAMSAGIHMITTDLIRDALNDRHGDVDLDAREELVTVLSLPLTETLGIHLRQVRELMDMVLTQIADNDFEGLENFAEILKSESFFADVNKELKDDSNGTDGE